MSNEKKDLYQKLSMLVDAELDGHHNGRLLEQIENDDQLRAAWSRYNMIGQAMRSPRGLLVDRDFASRVSFAISEEPTVLAPRRLPKAALTRRHRIATFALAASLAGVAVLIGKSLTKNAGDFSVASIDAKAPQSAENPADTQFNDYLLMHNETAYLAGSAGMLPYVRIVSYGADR